MRGTAGDHAYSGYGAQGDDGTVAQARAQVGLVPGLAEVAPERMRGEAEWVGGEGGLGFQRGEHEDDQGPNRVDGQDDERRVVQGAGTVLMAADCPAAPVRRDGHTFHPLLRRRRKTVTTQMLMNPRVRPIADA